MFFCHLCALGKSLFRSSDDVLIVLFFDIEVYEVIIYFLF